MERIRSALRVLTRRDPNLLARGSLKANLLERTGIGIRNGYLYLAKMNSVERWKLTAGQLKPAGEPEVVVSGLEDVEQHGGIWRFKEDRLGQKQSDGERYATGMRQMPDNTSGTAHESE